MKTTLDSYIRMRDEKKHLTTPSDKMIINSQIKKITETLNLVNYVKEF